MEQQIQLIISAVTLLGVVFAVYKYFRDPDIRADKTLAIMKERCDLKHQNIDANILAIKENHLRHLEADVQQIKIDIAKILAVMEERNK